MIGKMSALNAKSVLVFGGTRSGKTGFALELAQSSGLKPIMLATSRVEDEEMLARVEAHRAERGPEWALIEEPLDLAGALKKAASPQHIVVVDCLTLWLSNLMMDGHDIALESENLAATQLAGPVIFVSNELGLGTVPSHALTRKFRDAQGKLNQIMARACDHVIFVRAGLPQLLKPAPALQLKFRG